MISFPTRWQIFCCIVGMLFGLKNPNGYSNPINNIMANENAKTSLHDIYAEDDRLKPDNHYTYEHDKDSTPVGSYLYDQYMWVIHSYSESEIAGASHAYFDEQNRLLYALAYSLNIFGDSSSFCEENIYKRNDTEHTCRHIYYKSTSRPYDDGFYIAFRYMSEVCDYQFDEENRLLSYLSYERNIGSDPYGYSNELFFDRGYLADYDGKQLMAELQYNDYWGSNEFGVWEYRIYQYDDQGNCILTVVVTEDDIMLYCYEYHEDKNQIETYTYLVTDDWELSCDDGSIYYLYPNGKKPAIKKVAADKTVEKEYFYGKAIDIGQQNYLMPEDVEATLDDHMYTVEEGDCLWDIAYRYYEQGSYYDLIYRTNRNIIGYDENLLLPGTRLYIPEAGNAQNTKPRN